METRFRTRISRMFKSSLSSCKPKNLTDIMENQVFSPEKQHSFHMMEQQSPKLQPQPRPFPSICKPRCPDATETIVDDQCIVTHSDLLPRRKVSERISPFALGVIDGRMCPPASPISPVSHFYSVHNQFGYKNEHALMKTRKKKKSKKSTRAKTKKIELCPFSSSSHSHNTNFSGWFSSEDEADTFFSSRSLSSVSSEPRRRRPPRQKKKGSRQRRVNKNNSTTNREMSVLPLDGKVKDSFAVMKRSSDPYNDFRTSMVEMIVEKQIFATKDLEQLLQCFLSLNSQHYHRIIVEVFTEIHETLFSSWY